MTRAPKRRVYPSYGLSGSIFARIRQGLAEGIFNAADRNIAMAMSEKWHLTAWAPASRLAEQVGCDKATVSRFVRRLGYADYRALQRAAQSETGQGSDRHLSYESGTDDILPIKNSGAAQLAMQLHDFDRFAEQINVVASRISRATQIVIAGASKAADPWVPAIEDLFASCMVTLVRKAAAYDELAPRAGNHLIIIHVGPSISVGAEKNNCSSFHWGQAAADKVHAVHLVVGNSAPEQTDAQRVLHLQDDSDRLAGLSMMIEVCVLLIREAIRRDPAKARLAPE